MGSLPAEHVDTKLTAESVLSVVGFLWLVEDQQVHWREDTSLPTGT